MEARQGLDSDSEAGDRRDAGPSGLQHSSFWQRIGLRQTKPEPKEAGSKRDVAKTAIAESASQRADAIDEVALNVAAREGVEVATGDSLREQLGSFEQQLARLEQALEARGEQLDRRATQLLVLEDRIEQLTDLREWMGEARESERQIGRRLRSLERSVRLALATGLALGAAAIAILARDWLGF